MWHRQIDSSSLAARAQQRRHPVNRFKKRKESTFTGARPVQTHYMTEATMHMIENNRDRVGQG
jgi:hypothetical protein